MRSCLVLPHRIPHLKYLLLVQAGGRSQLLNLVHVFLDLPQIVLPYEGLIPLCDVAALSGDFIEEPLLLQLLVGSFGRDDADPQILRQIPDRRERVVCLQPSVQNLLLDQNYPEFGITQTMPKKKLCRSS